MSKIATYDEIEDTIPESCPGCGKSSTGRHSWHRPPAFVPYQESGVCYFGEPAVIEEEHLTWACWGCGFVFQTPTARKFHPPEDPVPEPPPTSGKMLF